ncbi:hypothetical protein AGMMS49950_10620 [Endomicrobiia bacterium]|nr:hypothetical protein AGMMS49950_10620 [Endomicrobiia bacterium]
MLDRESEEKIERAWKEVRRELKKEFKKKNAAIKRRVKRTVFWRGLEQEIDQCNIEETQEETRKEESWRKIKEK